MLKKTPQNEPKQKKVPTLDLPNYFLWNSCCVFYREVELKNDMLLKSTKILPHDSSWNRALPRELSGSGLLSSILRAVCVAYLMIN